MNDVWPTLIPILFVDVISPILVAAMVYAAGTERPIVNTSAVLAGHTITYVLIGFVLSFGVETISHRIENPNSVDFSLGLVVGVALLYGAIRLRKPAEKNTPPIEQALAPVSSLKLGSTISLLGVPFALPYLAALSQILQANLSTSQSVLLLFGYNLLYAAPFLLIPAAVVVLGARSKPVLARFTEIVDKTSAKLMPILLALVGLALMADAISYFMSGNGLF